MPYQPQASTSHRSGRPPATSRAELEAAAFRLFARRGYDHTTIDDIAAAAGIARRTFFRYFRSKTDLVWGDFGAELDRLRAWLARVPDDVPLMDAVRGAVLEFNSLPTGAEAQHRQRMALILTVPTLLADSTLRFAEWRAVVAEFAGRRMRLLPDHLQPQVVAHAALGAAVAAYEQWLGRPHADQADLTALLEEALRQLGSGFRVHDASR